MASINKVILIGNLGKDPELRTAGNSGRNICNLSVATTRKFKDSSGNLTSETEWHRVVCFDNVADVAAKFLRKGSPVYIEGSLHTRKFTDKQGREQFQTDIICANLQML